MTFWDKRSVTFWDIENYRLKDEKCIKIGEIMGYIDKYSKKQASTRHSSNEIIHTQLRKAKIA